MTSPTAPHTRALRIFTRQRTQSFDHGSRHRAKQSRNMPIPPQLAHADQHAPSTLVPTSVHMCVCVCVCVTCINRVHACVQVSPPLRVFVHACVCVCVGFLNWKGSLFKPVTPPGALSLVAGRGVLLHALGVKS